MTCFNPITIWIKDNEPIDMPYREEQYQKNWHKAKMKYQKDCYSIEVPCGNCLGCRLDHANMWATRIYMENKYWKKSCFVTLTYNPTNLEYNEKNPKKELIQKDLQDFLKRLRYYNTGAQQWINPNNQKLEYPIRYFGCGEYGPKNGRPHYHLCIFNYKPADLKFYKKNAQGDNLYTSKELQTIWGKGFVVIGEVTEQSACYVARYVQKKAGISKKIRIYEYDKIKCTRKIKKNKLEKKQEFICMSTGVGIGRLYWDEKKEILKDTQTIPVKTKEGIKNKPLPRYFKKQWEKENWQDYEQKKYENQKKAIENRKKIINSESYSEKLNEKQKWQKHLEKSKRLLEQKAKLLKRNNFI